MLIQIRTEVPESFTRALLGLSAVLNGFNATEFWAKCRLLMQVQTATDAGFPLWNFSIIKAESANERSQRRMKVGVRLNLALKTALFLTFLQTFLPFAEALEVK